MLDLLKFSRCSIRFFRNEQKPDPQAEFPDPQAEFQVFSYYFDNIDYYIQFVRNSGKSAEILQKVSWNVLEICILKNRQFHIISLFHLVIPIRPDGSGGTTWPIRGSRGIPTTPPLHTRRSPAIGFA